MAMAYRMWRCELRGEYCVIDPPIIDRIWELDDGISRIGDFPDDVSCKMSSRYPKNIQLSDNVYGAGVPVISLKLKEFLEKKILPNRLEYLPVRIMNHKGRVASNDYFIMNVRDICDCIDLEKSGVEWNQILPTLISRCKGLVLKNELIPEDYKIFRLKNWGYNILVRSDLVTLLQASNFTGLEFMDTTGYTGIG